VNLKKLLTWAGVALLVFALVTQPNQSAGVVSGILNSLRSAAEAVMAFVRAIFA
jgi:hypothetical protein